MQSKLDKKKNTPPRPSQAGRPPRPSPSGRPLSQRSPLGPLQQEEAFRDRRSPRAPGAGTSGDGEANLENLDPTTSTIPTAGTPSEERSFRPPTAAAIVNSPQGARGGPQIEEDEDHRNEEQEQRLAQITDGRDDLAATTETVEGAGNLNERDQDSDTEVSIVRTTNLEQEIKRLEKAAAERLVKLGEKKFWPQLVGFQSLKALYLGQEPVGPLREDEESRHGGYCNFANYEIINKRYFTLRKIGCGPNATTWMCWDSESGRFVAIKILRPVEINEEGSENEILEFISENQSIRYVVKYNDCFEYLKNDKPNMCLVFHLLGLSLFNYQRYLAHKGRIPDIKMVKTIAQNLLDCLQFLHEKCKIIHGDINPTNLLFFYSKDHYQGCLELDQSGVSPELKEIFEKAKKEIEGSIKKIEAMKVLWNLKLAGFGKAKKADTITGTKFGGLAGYRSPESLLRLEGEYKTATDIWSAGCCIYEFATGQRLFPKNTGTSSDYLESIVRRFGPIPQRMKQYPYPDNLFKGISSEATLFSDEPMSDGLGIPWPLGTEDWRDIRNLLQGMLEVDPEDRWSARECLEQRFLE